SEGRYGPLLAQSRLLASSVGESIAHGMQLSVSCTEDAPDLVAAPEDAGSVIGNQIVDLLLTQCQAWPTRPRAEDFRTPLAGEVPVLALSGEHYPVVAPGQGHNVIGAGCMPKLFAQFVERADAEGIDASCLDQLAASPPFAGHYGWEP